eukprot:s7059_g2.t1
MTTHNCLGDFQALHNQCLEEKRPDTAGPTRVYPSNPQELGAAWLQKVYGQDCLPGKQVPMAAWMNKVACRSTNKMLQSSQVAKSSTPTMADEKTNKELLQELLAEHEKPAQVTFATQGTGSTESLAQQRPVATPQATLLSQANAEPLLREAKKVPSNDADKVPASNCKSKDLEAMEEEAFQQLQKIAKGKGMKRPARKMDMAAASQCSQAESSSKGQGQACSQSKSQDRVQEKGQSKGWVPSQDNLAQPSGAKVLE